MRHRIIAVSTLAFCLSACGRDDPQIAQYRACIHRFEQADPKQDALDDLRRGTAKLYSYRSEEIIPGYRTPGLPICASDWHFRAELQPDTRELPQAHFSESETEPKSPRAKCEGAAVAYAEKYNSTLVKADPNLTAKLCTPGK